MSTAEGTGQAAFPCLRLRRDPALVLSLLLYGYCVGERSSRRLERWCYEHVAFRVAAGNQQPHFTTIARFRREHAAALATVFVQFLAAVSNPATLARARSNQNDSNRCAGRALYRRSRSSSGVMPTSSRIDLRVPGGIVRDAWTAMVVKRSPFASRTCEPFERIVVQPARITARNS